LDPSPKAPAANGVVLTKLAVPLRVPVNEWFPPGSRVVGMRMSISKSPVDGPLEAVKPKPTGGLVLVGASTLPSTHCPAPAQ
jgi:hypothetical protein